MNIGAAKFHRYNEEQETLITFYSILYGDPLKGYWTNEAAVREQVTALLEYERMMMMTTTMITSINSNILPKIQHNT